VTRPNQSLFCEIDDFGLDLVQVVQYVVILGLEILLEERDHASVRNDGNSPSKGLVGKLIQATQLAINCFPAHRHSFESTIRYQR
jgi:hypothetical protein